MADAATKPLRAYALRDRHDDEKGAEVVFARTSREARKHCTLDDVAWIDVGVRRAPEFDDLAAERRRPTVAEYLARGWFWQCSECEASVYEDPDAGHVIATWECWCSPACHARSLGRRRGYAFRDAECENARAEAQRRWSDAEVILATFVGRAWNAPLDPEDTRVHVRLYWKRGDADVYANWSPGDATHSEPDVYPRARTA